MKALDSRGDGSYFDAAQGITYAVDHGARVINCSFGGRGEDGDGALAEAVAYAQEHGAMVVAAAGNANSSVPYYPAAYPGVVAVGATNRQDQRASYSSYGSHLWVTAPGGDGADGILSTVWSSSDDEDYKQGSGTSMATPYVSGLAALVWSTNPELTMEEVKQTLKNTAVDLGPLGFDNEYGWGRIDAHAAVRSGLYTTLEFPHKVYLPLISCAR